MYPVLIFVYKCFSAYLNYIFKTSNENNNDTLTIRFKVYTYSMSKSRTQKHLIPIQLHIIACLGNEPSIDKF